MTTYKTTERQRVYARAYRLKNAAKLSAYREKFRLKARAANKAYYVANRDKMLEKSNRYFETHPGYRKATFKRYYDNNRDKIRVRKLHYGRKRWKTDPLHRLQTNLRARIYQALKSKKRHSNRTMKWTGCTIEFLKGWLESRFQPGMTWENYNQHGWHVDHVIPCSVFDLSDLEQALQCFHYSNLQPLWAGDNLRKSNFAGDGAQPKNTYEEREYSGGSRESNLKDAAGTTIK